jgi:chromosome partitioning protein
MPVIVFASPKGGAGKTTSSFILATEMASKGIKTVIIDADPNHPILNWKNRGGNAENLTIVANDDEDAILEDIDQARKIYDFVIVDLEGTANLSVAYAISRADLVIIPSQRSTLDAGEAAKAVSLVKRQSSVANRTINFALLLTRTSAAIRTKSLKRMVQSIEEKSIDIFETEIIDREAFKAIFDHTKTLGQLSSSHVSGIDSARSNAQSFAYEVISKLKKNINNKNKNVEIAGAL